MTMLELLHRSDISGTFFIQNKVASKYPVLVRKIETAGHEIGCYLDALNNPQQFRKEAQYAIQNLEDISGSKIYGTRTTGFSLSDSNFDHYCNILKTQDIQYDSSLVTHHSINKLEALNPSIGAFKAYDIWQHTLPPSFGGTIFRLAPYEFSYFMANRLNRDSTVFQLPVYDIGVNEYTSLKSSFQLPWHHKMDFYGRQSIPVKLQKLFADFPFSSFSDYYST